MSALDELKNFERRIDQVMEGLSVFRQAVRVPLSGIVSVLHGLLHGQPSINKGSRREAAYAFAARMAYLTPLLAKCPAEPLGTNARNVLEAWAAEQQEFKTGNRIVAYAYFCELMPEVHRGYFDITGSETAGFTLRHRSVEFSAFEAQDILLSEAALATGQGAPPDYDRIFDELAKTAPTLNPTLADQMQTALARHYEESLFELPLVSDSGLQIAAGLSHREFKRFRSALFGLSEFAVQLSMALERRFAKNPNDDAAFDEMLEWITICWKEDALLRILENLTKLEQNQLEPLLSLYGLDFRNDQRNISHAAEGFFPPLVRLPGTILVFPDLVKFFLQTRNLLYAVQRRNPKLFDNLISRHLEPELLRTVKCMLEPFKELQVQSNITWERGEIDLLVYDPRTNSAIHIQAKAPLPPQGARMVGRLEYRLREGLDQVRRFSALPTNRRDAILSHALCRIVENVQVYDVLLARSCFGTQTLGTDAGSIDLISLPILSGSLTDCVESGAVTVPAIVQRCRENLRELVMNARPQWIHDILWVENVALEIPLFQFDLNFVDAFRKLLWRGRGSLAV